MKEARALAAIAALSAAIVIFLAVSPLTAGSKSSETGYIKDGIYHDSRFGFSAKIPFDWREAKLRKEPSPERLYMLKRKPQVPLRLQSNPELALTPVIMILADSTNMTPAQFFAFLQADTGKTKFKQSVLSKSVFLEQGVSNSIQVLEKMTTKVAGRDALRLRSRLEYNVQVQTTGVSSPTQINDFRTGFIYIVPFDGWLMYVEEACEDQFFDNLAPDFDSLITSLTLEAPADTTMEKK